MNVKRKKRGKAAGSSDDVERLMRLAGKRQALPPDRAERVRSAARIQWKDEVRRRSRRRYVWAGVGTVAAASLVVLIAINVRSNQSETVPQPATATANTTETGPLVETLAGPAWSRIADVADDERPLEVGARLDPDSELTTAEAGRTSLRLASGHSVRLDHSTVVRLLADGSLALDRGSIYVDSGLDRTGTAPLYVQTPLGTIQEIGTQFEVRLDADSVRIRLREGAVVLRHEGVWHQVPTGTELVLGADGTAKRRAISRHGPDWEWMAAVTPMPDLEGMTARAFLDWVARERGFQLAFDDEAVERSAADTVLGGTVASLGLDEALDAVLPTCRMTYRIDRGVLRVATE